MADLDPNRLRNLHRYWQAANYPQAGPLMEWCQEMLAKHQTYTREHFEDMPEVRDWVWTDNSSSQPPTPRPTLSPRKERSDGILNR